MPRTHRARLMPQRAVMMPPRNPPTMAGIFPTVMEATPNWVPEKPRSRQKGLTMAPRKASPAL